MTLTIEIPDAAADRVRAVAEAQGQDLNTFATALLLDVAADNGNEEKPDPEVMMAAQESVDDVRAGRLFTLDEIESHMEEALAEVKRNRQQAPSAAAAFVAAP